VNDVRPVRGSVVIWALRQRKAHLVDIRIGIFNSPREIGFETSQPANEVEETVAAALAGQTGYLKLSDSKGKVYIVPTIGLAYVELGSEESRRVGFVA
jgi:hypothetical protein